MPRREMRPFSEWIEVLDHIEREIGGQNFILFGSIAMGVYGAPRDSKNIDIITREPMVAGLSDISKLLINEGFVMWKVQWIEEGLVRRFNEDEVWYVDVVEATREAYAKIKRKAIEVDFDENRTIFVMSFDDLIKRKKERATPQDVVDIMQLEWLKKRYESDRQN